jgi:hypothetical protein
MTLSRPKVEIKAELRIFVMSALGEVEWSASVSSRMNPTQGVPVIHRRLR